MTLTVYKALFYGVLKDLIPHFKNKMFLFIVTNQFYDKKGEKMNLSEFQNLFDNGFRENYAKGTSDLRCPNCGNESYLTTKNGIFTSTSKVTCKNNHNFQLIDFTVAWTQIRNDLLTGMLNNSCDAICTTTE